MTFPTSASNAQTVVVNGITYVYNSFTNAWTRVQNPVSSLPTPILNTTNVTVANLATVNGSIGIGTTTPLASLDLSNRTDMLLMPSGTTAQRPAIVANGAMRFNTTTNSPEWYNGLLSTWQQFSQIPQVTQYTGSYLIVAGGGGGGNGGGGGAGGLLSGNLTLTYGTSYPIVVGAGSASALIAGVFNTGITTGSNSTFNSQTALGGGAGAVTSVALNGTSYQGYPGGSGGGAGGNSNSNSQVVSGGSGTSGQGNNGGTCPGAGNSPGGGGGGAGATGGNGSSGSPGGGGIGANSSITGTSVAYAGGGGGGSYGVGGSSGGLGGGGAGVQRANTAGSGTPNTGGGGGSVGSDGTSASSSGAGGSGVVIISYASPFQRGTGGTVTSYTLNGSLYWVHTFTSSGTYVA